MVAVMSRPRQPARRAAREQTDEELRLTIVWRRLRRGSQRARLAARNELVEHYRDLVVYHAQRLWARLPAGVELDDLISSGIFGLMQAIDAYDPARGVKFTTYAAGRIRGAMLDELRAMDWVPRLVRSKATRLAEAHATLHVRLGREASEAELRVYLRIEPDQWAAWIRDATPQGMLPLDTEPTPDAIDSHPHPQADTLTDSRLPGPDVTLRAADLLRLVTAEMTIQERLIVILYYYERLTMREIGQTLGCSESRVSQLHRQLIARLRELLGERREEWL